MDVPRDDQGLLHELENGIAAELNLAESSESAQLVDVRIDELLFDPTETERYVVGLRGLLGAVEAVDDDTVA